MLAISTKFEAIGASTVLARSINSHTRPTRIEGDKMQIVQVLPENGSKRKKLWIRIKLMSTTMSLLLSAAGLLGLSAPSASAAILYPTNPVRACQEQGHLGASFWNATPYGWYCYDFSPAPPFWAPAGGVDFQRFCNRHYPGTRAIIYSNNLFGWRCST